MGMQFIKPDTRIEFMGHRKLFLAISGAAILASLVAILFMGLNLGIDFKGGTKVILAFKGDQEIDRDRIRALAEKTFAEMMPGQEVPQV
ncbi:MAG: hypothetical protein FJ098_10710, partial [Deltaproteobacteria bacterium]|nr:hypothetical protein [Deltaproteobacteria bacterium]